jgi:hypothetical protein
LPSADSINLASRKRWQTDRAISRAIEKVVVVVVVTILEGSLGSGIRLDWENFSDPRLLMASSDKNECSTLVSRTRCPASGRLTTNVAKRSLKSYEGKILALQSNIRSISAVFTLVNGLSSEVMRNKREDV